MHANQDQDICEEFIPVMAKFVKNEIISQIKSPKYFSLSVDSTPDVAHVDQLSIVFGAFLSETILQVLIDNDINNCRSQTYDNARNMSGKYSGLQARIIEVKFSCILCFLTIFWHKVLDRLNTTRNYCLIKEII